MTHEIQTQLPKAANGLTLPLSKHLGSRALAEHRAMLAMECEFLAKKFDGFGWDRDRNTPSQDRQKLDFMDALQDYPLSEVQAACRAAVLNNPNKMPNEGHIIALIMDARRLIVRSIPKPLEPDRPQITQEELDRRRRFADETLRKIRRIDAE